MDKFWGEANDQDKIEYSEVIKKSFEKFTLLKGVGPAMASLFSQSFNQNKSIFDTTIFQ